MNHIPSPYYLPITKNDAKMRIEPSASLAIDTARPFMPIIAGTGRVAVLGLSRKASLPNLF
jgi:hypothetical protein